MASKTMGKDLVKVLPKAWTNEIANSTEKAVTIRSNIENMEDINDWVVDFGRNTQTRWNARMCHASKQKFVCSKEFVCHHSKYNKTIPTASEGKPTKNTQCRAKIRAKIKLYTQNTRYTDPYVLKRLCGVIVIELEHNHYLGTPESLRWLPADYKIKDMFLGYYKSGMRIAQSCHYHKRILESQEECEREGWLVDRRINPNQRIVRSWHDQWRLMNVPIKKAEDLEIKRPKRKRRKLSPFSLKPSNGDEGKDDEVGLEVPSTTPKEKDPAPTRNLRSNSVVDNNINTSEICAQNENGKETDQLKLNSNSRNRIDESVCLEDTNQIDTRLDNSRERVDDDASNDSLGWNQNIEFDSGVLIPNSPDFTQESQWHAYIKRVVQKMKKIDGVRSRRTVKEKFNRVLSAALSGEYESLYPWLKEFQT